LTDQPNGDDLAVPSAAKQAIRFDPLNPGANAAIFGSLTQEQQSSLLMEYMRGNLDIGKKAAQMHVDIDAFRNMLDVMAAKTRELSDQENTSVTMSHTQDTSVGKTEVIMGNTAQAASGRLTRTMAGERDMRLFYVVGGAIVVLILVSLFVRH
jgi:hypothetical protein